jgi:hypothetical protein
MTKIPLCRDIPGSLFTREGLRHSLHVGGYHERRCHGIHNLLLLLMSQTSHCHMMARSVLSIPIKEGDQAAAGTGAATVGALSVHFASTRGQGVDEPYTLNPEVSLSSLLNLLSRHRADTKDLH